MQAGDEKWKTSALPEFLKVWMCLSLSFFVPHAYKTSLSVRNGTTKTLRKDDHLDEDSFAGPALCDEHR